MSPSSGQLHLTGNLEMGWNLLPRMAERALLDSHQQNWALKLYPAGNLSKARKALKARWVVPSLCWHSPLKSCFLQKHSKKIYFRALPTNQLFLTLCSTLAKIWKCKREKSKWKVKARMPLMSKAPEINNNTLDEYAKPVSSFKKN